MVLLSLRVISDEAKWEVIYRFGKLAGKFKRQLQNLEFKLEGTESYKRAVGGELLYARAFFPERFQIVEKMSLEMLECFSSVPEVTVKKSDCWHAPILYTTGKSEVLRVKPSAIEKFGTQKLTKIQLINVKKNNEKYFIEAEVDI